MALQMRLIPLLPPGGILNAAQVFTALHNGVRDQSAESVRFMSTYPPKPGKSRYRRTGTLRRSWSFTVKSGNRRVEGSVNSNSGIAPYNEDVQGENQRPLFETLGWRNVKDLEKKVGREFVGRLERIVKRAAP